MSRDPRFYELKALFLEDCETALRRVQADNSLLDVRSGLGETLLHWFAIEYREDLVKTLADAGAAIDPRNKFGNTPLFEAALIGNEGMCRLLLSMGASPDTANYEGQRPLMNAASLGVMKICKLLVEHGAQIGARGLNEATAVSAASISGQIEVLKLFLDHLDPAFDINMLFSDMDADIVHQVGGHVASLLKPLGLRSPFEELMSLLP